MLSTIDDILKDFKKDSYYLNETFKEYIKADKNIMTTKRYEYMKSRFILEIPREVLDYYDNLFYGG
jgi:hypothetical protein